MAELTRAIALDCEMVGVACSQSGYGMARTSQDMVARVSLVNEHLECVLDTFVKPTQTVKDYRTSFSGVTKADLENGENFDELYRNRTPSLRWLSERYLGVKIQKGEQFSLDDARTAMRLYKKFASDWEKSLGN